MLQITPETDIDALLQKSVLTKIYAKLLLPRGTKLTKVDAIRDALKVIGLDGLKQGNQHKVCVYKLFSLM